MKELLEVARERELKVIHSVFDDLIEVLKYDNIKFVTHNDGERVMGYDRHKTILVLSDNYRESRNKFQEAINRLKEIGLPIKARITEMLIEIDDFEKQLEDAKAQGFREAIKEMGKVKGA